jgi:hypothetical protein
VIVDNGVRELGCRAIAVKPLFAATANPFDDGFSFFKTGSPSEKLLSNQPWDRWRFSNFTSSAFY